ncbi:DUF3943 domain-containing protein [Endozoicomonas sp.]|uniref:DUF3943 domain-containing protein n=1 Tax=Endozoicomonas sp. TaxID=1892382 RepID=UPI00383A5B42
MLNLTLPAFLSGLIMLSGFAQANTTAPAVTTESDPDTEFTFSLQEERSPWAVTLFDENPKEDQARLWGQTKLMFGLGVGVVAALAVMPESFTNWDKDELKNFHKKWWDNVSSGPVMDEDEWFLNYVTHPYFGGVYYIVARESGYDQWNSFVYSFLMSTFYWEYGIEAIAEVPSIQDIIITPVGGWLYGEWAYQKKLTIRDNDNLVWDSPTLGSTALFFLDPVDSIDQWINGGREEPLVEDLSISMAFAPTFYRWQDSEEDRNYLGLVMTFRM